MSVVTEKTPLSFREVVDKYSDVSPFVILKTDVQRRGVSYSEAALAQVDPAQHLTQARSIFHSIGEKDAPVSLLLRDGTSILAGPRPNADDPYQVDYIDGRLVLTDRGDILEEVEYWQKPDYADKFTSSGRPMWQVAEAEDLASQGVVTIYCVWVPIVGSVFHKQKAPSLEYFVRLAKGLDAIRRQYDLRVDMDSYRVCGNHPDTDLSRI